MSARFRHRLAHLLGWNQGEYLFWIRHDRGAGQHEGFVAFQCAGCGRIQGLRRLKPGEKVDLSGMRLVGRGA